MPNNDELLRASGRRAALKVSGLAALLLLAPAAASAQKAKQPQFAYVAGTEDVLAGCEGTIELTSQQLSFLCAQYSLHAPYAAISRMEYRSGVSRSVRKLKLKWKLKPPEGGGKKNRYFTIVYREGGATHVVVLEVAPDEMQPYLAEIDLKAGRRVDVQNHEDYP
ncbi:MAG TPA: hypothetical protein VGW33_07565 [Terriglobia bacterium]|nr:hypothetical protein [Terriglobia bacterium]